MQSPALVCHKQRTFEPGLWRRWLQLPPPQASLPDEFPETEVLLSRLVELGLLLEAARVLAYGLPEREAVWWSCMCVRHTLPRDPADAEAAAVAAAEAWVRRPDNPSRHEAARAATAAGTDAPGAWCALAAAWSHRIKQRPDLCGGRGAAAAVEKSSLRLHPDRADARLRRFVHGGIDVSNGGAGRLPAEKAS
jgi:hypothetical protein